MSLSSKEDDNLKTDGLANDETNIASYTVYEEFPQDFGVSPGDILGLQPHAFDGLESRSDWGVIRKENQSVIDLTNCSPNSLLQGDFRVSMEAVGAAERKWIFSSLMNKVGRLGDPNLPGTSRCILLQTVLLLFHNLSHAQAEYQAMDLYGLLHLGSGSLKVDVDWGYDTLSDTVDLPKAYAQRIPRINIYVGDLDGEHDVLRLTPVSASGALGQCNRWADGLQRAFTHSLTGWKITYSNFLSPVLIILLR